MHILLYHRSVIPPENYGGIERVVYWLARELVRKGHRISVMADRKSRLEQVLPGVRLIPVSRSTEDYRRLVPADVDVIHFHETPPLDRLPGQPFMVTIHGNCRPGERFAPNTVFLSRSHARHHNAPLYVYNGVPKDEYPLETQKDQYFLFLAKLAWRRKNARTAINLSLDAQVPLKLTGGFLWRTPNLWGGWMGRWLLQPAMVSNEGPVDGERKIRLLQKARALFSVVNWQEPFGLAPHEALACGTPVLATPNGALAEYIQDGINGYLVRSYDEAIRALIQVWRLAPQERVALAQRCRETAFSAQATANHYEEYYKKLMKDKFLYPPEQAEKIAFSPPPAVIVGKGR